MLKVSKILSHTLLVGGIMNCTTNMDKTASITQPKAAKITKILEKHSDKRTDDFYWMNERDSPEVLKYLKTENKYLEKILFPTKKVQVDLFNEMKDRIIKKDSTAPYLDKGYYYYSKTEEDSNYAIYCRKKKTLEHQEEILLDANILAKSYEFFDISEQEVSPDHKLLAYSHDTVGRRIYNISIKNITNKTTKEDIIQNITGNFIWGEDNNTLFYTKQDLKTLRSYQLWSYNIETKRNELLYEEEDDTFSLHVWKSTSKKYLFLSSNSTLTTEIRYLNLKEPNSKLSIFSTRKRGVEYTIEDGGSKFFVLTNSKVKNFSLMVTSPINTDLSSWEDFIKPDKKVLTDDFLVFEKFIVVRESHEGLLKFKVIERDHKNHFYIETNDETYQINFYINPNYYTSKLNYSYESMTTPYSVFQYDMVSKEKTTLKEKQVAGNFDKRDYASKRIFATARDGEMIPISLVYKKDLEINDKTPLLQYAYGSYGHTIDPYFSTQRLSLLNRGFVFAICHIRGGSYKGRSWYETGKMLYKKNTFYDFIDCSKFLIKKRYTSSKHLYAEGASAGGLLMGAIANMEGTLYHGIIAGVPFVDVITTMLDNSIPLTTSEYDEWGNPNKEDEYWYIKSYSPYDNVTKKDYPNILVTTGYHDSQVQYWEPAKWVAKLREYKTNHSLLAFKTDFSSGHSGASGRFDHLKDTALEYSFLLYLEGKI